MKKKNYYQALSGRYGLASHCTDAGAKLPAKGSSSNNNLRTLFYSKIGGYLLEYGAPGQGVISEVRGVCVLSKSLRVARPKSFYRVIIFLRILYEIKYSVPNTTRSGYKSGFIGFYSTLKQPENTTMKTWNIATKKTYLICSLFR